MILIAELKALAKARLKDAKALRDASRFDGSVYMAGYAVELSLKLRICKTLKWVGFPETGKEFESYKSFKTHDLDVLLHLSGIEARIKKSYFTEWSIVASWDPEARYNPVGKVTSFDATTMIVSVGKLINTL